VASLIRWIRELIRRLLEWIKSLFGGGGGPIEDDRCCSLARLDNECRYVGGKSNFTCPEGYHRQWWHCCEGTRLLGCGECTTSTSTCWSGSFECSIWWQTDQPC
jgi:hypothetical protein